MNLTSLYSLGKTISYETENKKNQGTEISESWFFLA